ncbi:MAG: hypothetical protein AAGA95_16145 [Pseudomonadota bacterium]
MYTLADAVWQLEQQLEASLISSDFLQFGAAIDLDSNRLMVAVPGDSSRNWGTKNGAIALYQFDGTRFNLDDYIVPPDRVGSSANDGFVRLNSKARLSGSTIVYHGNARTRAYEEVGGRWVPRGIFNDFGTDSAGYDIGRAVDIDGDTVAVSRVDRGGFFPLVIGEITIFRRPPTGSEEWIQHQVLRAASPPWSGLGNSLGLSLQIDGDVLIAGAPGARNEAGAAHGQAFVFERESDGLWRQTHRLSTTSVEAMDPAEFSYLGGSVAVDAGLAIVGNEFEHVPGFQNPTGTASIFELPVSDVICDGAMNSVSVVGAVLQATGSRSASFGHLVFKSSQLPPRAASLLLAARSTGTTSVGSGVLCLGGDVRRVPGSLRTSDPLGRLTIEIALGSVAFLSPIAGETLYFQSWYRDVGGTSNLSNAISVSFE